MAKKYHQIAGGWYQINDKTGEQYISAMAENKKLRIFAELENGEVVQIERFAVYTNAEKKSERSADVRFVFTTEE